MCASSRPAHRRAAAIGLAACCVLLVTLLSAGCSAVDQLRSDQPAAAAPGPAPTPAPSPEPTPAPGPEPTPAPSSAPAPGGSSAIDKSARHPDLLNLKLTSIAFAPDAITVGVEATNGGQEDVNLNPSDDLVLVDDRGNRYAVNPPPSNPTVSVAKGTTLRGSLVFLGQLDPAAASLTLITCDDFGSTSDKYSRYPKLVIAGLPVGR
jgi:hypothetical protein